MSKAQSYLAHLRCDLKVCMFLLLIGIVSCSDTGSEQYMVEAETFVVSPVCPVLSTGQTRSRAPGDDGDWQAGKSVSNHERFEEHGHGVFVDHLTGLMWMFALPTAAQIGYGEVVRSSDETAIAGNLFIKEKDVSRFLAEMNAGRFKDFGKGFVDWRWPSVVELVSLFQFTGFERQYFAEEFVAHVFGRFDSGSFTTSTHVMDVQGGRFVCNLSGAVKKIRLNRSRDRCLVLVRSIPPATNKTDEGQPFVPLAAIGPREIDLEARKQWPDPRFEILPSGSEREAKDDVVVDNLSGLFWARNANLAGKRNWHEALKYCNDFKLGGYDDWRMPNVFEMLSVICYGFNSPALANTAGDSQWKEADPFVGVMNDLYWTSTAEEPRVSHSYVVNVKDGTLKTDYGQPIKGLLDRTLGEYPKHFVWPVRGGEVLNRTPEGSPIRGDGKRKNTPPVP